MAKPLWGLWGQPFFQDFDECHNILLAGCGGGYDFMNAVPLYFAIKHRREQLGKPVNLYISNQSFSSLTNLENAQPFGKSCVKITTETKRKFNPRTKSAWSLDDEDYFPELFLTTWFQNREGLDVPIYTFAQDGVAHLLESYNALKDELHLDCVILVDGGTDSLMRGNEIELGTPTEDMSSIAAINLLHVPKKYLACIGMGVDTFHGVNHGLYLENVAELLKEGAFLGSFSLLHTFVEAAKFESAYLACQPDNSIVCSSVLSAVKGEFGNYHSQYTKHRTGASRLFISPLMNQYWCFHLGPLASKVLYLDQLKDTKTMGETSKLIHTFHRNVKKKREASMIPY